MKFVDNFLARSLKLAIVCAALPVAAIAAESGCGGEKTVSLPEYSDPRTPIPASAGSAFVISLESNPTTGYSWQLASPPDPRILKKISSEFVPGPPQRIGSGGREYWKFQALAPGRATVSLRYIRPWEKSSTPAREADFRITVTP